MVNKNKYSKKHKKDKNHKKDKGGFFYYGYNYNKPKPKPVCDNFSSYECDMKTINRLKMLIELTSLNSKNSKQLLSEGHLQSQLKMTQSQIEQWVEKYRRDNDVLKQNTSSSEQSGRLDRYLSAEDSVRPRHEGILAGPAILDGPVRLSRNSSLKTSDKIILGNYTFSKKKKIIGLTLDINLTYSIKNKNFMDISLKIKVPFITLPKWLPKDSSVMDQIKETGDMYVCEFKDLTYEHISGNQYEITDDKFKNFMENLSHQVTSHNWSVPDSLKVTNFDKRIEIDDNKLTISVIYQDNKKSTYTLIKDKGGRIKKTKKKSKKKSKK
tara:strand:+ start:518 stop:1492 length:975 start_codon:yes stop_codon:yes gene_type:complete